MKVLLVEDSKAVAVVLSHSLIDLGFEVNTVRNGLEAIQMYALEVPDLILMDLEMPVMNGFEATSRIRALEAERHSLWTPIIFLTAADSPQNILTAIQSGADDFLSKLTPLAVLQAKMQALYRIAAQRQQLVEANRLLTEQASRDGLTGICNRRTMDVRTNRLWDKMVSSSQPMGLLMIDIDHFKRFNDTYGHQAGDEVLRRVAAGLEHSVSKACEGEYVSREAFVARYGGEEFAVVLPGATRDVVDVVASALVLKVRQMAIEHSASSEQFITLSVGCSWTDCADGKINHLFRDADKALYLAKENGRNQRQWLKIPLKAVA